MGQDSLTAPFALSTLLCDEDEACLNEQENELKAHMELDFDPCSVLEDEDEYIENLVQRERAFGSKTNAFTKSRKWLRTARLESIEWIFNRRAMFGFKFHTAYLSVSYFDRFLSIRFVDEAEFWAVRLLSVACLTLAAKMEEPKVPALSEFQLEDFDFENKVLQRMELLVLTTLEWRLISITPFSYLRCFTKKFCVSVDYRLKEFVSSAVELIMATTKEMNLMDHRPSVIAAAAVLAASNDQLTRENVETNLKLISSFGSLENELVFFYYNLMQKIRICKRKMPGSIISPTVSFTSAAVPKRRLTYSDYHQNYPVKKIRRHEYQTSFKQ